MAEGTAEVDAPNTETPVTETVASPKARASKPSTPSPPSEVKNATASPVKTKILSPKVASSTASITASSTASSSNGVKEDPAPATVQTKAEKAKSPTLAVVTPSAASKSDKDASPSPSPASSNSLSSSKAPSPSSSGKSSASPKPADQENDKVERTSSKRNTRSKNSSQEARKGSDGSQRSLIGKEVPTSATSDSKQDNNQATSSNPAATREQKFRNYSNKSEKSKKKQTQPVEADNGDDSEDDSVPDNSVSKRQTIDVSQFLDVKSFSNSVEIAVNNSKFTCSGAVLAYHSPVMASILLRGANIITLDKLCTPGADIAIEESLILLYGGGAVITISNIETMTKFSVLYQVENLYRLCCEWIRHYVSVENIYDMWLLGSIDYITAKQTRRKNNIVHICRNFIKNKECEIALELRKRKKAKVEIQEGFILLMLQCTDYSTMFSDLL